MGFSMKPSSVDTHLSISMKHFTGRAYMYNNLKCYKCKCIVRIFVWHKIKYRNLNVCRSVWLTLYLVHASKGSAIV